MFTLLTFFTLVIYEPTDFTYDIDVYDYSEKPTIEVICPEGVFDTDCLEPRVETKKEISLEDIQECAGNNSFFF